jgi:hypothetical protein
MFTELLGQLAIVATFVQKAIAFVKPLYKDNEYQKWIDLGLSIAVSAALCFAWNVDAFAVANIALPFFWLGSVLTGVVAGLGANVLNDFLTLLEMWKKQKQIDVAYKAADLAFADEFNAKLAVEAEASKERGS